jgi:hypothetical protein
MQTTPTNFFTMKVSIKRHVILHRHGARGPSNGALKCFDQQTSFVSQWKEDEIEQLSTIGLKQMKRLGFWKKNTISI